jgi:HSP20 family protein
MSTLPWVRRWDPFREFQREMHQLLDSIEPAHGWRVARPFPPMNLYETEEGYRLEAELPGLNPEDVEISLTGETLTLRGERKRSEGTSEDSFRRQERPFFRWSRSVTLPQRVSGAGVAAQFSNGILTIQLPKAEEARPRQIAVTATS